MQAIGFERSAAALLAAVSLAATITACAIGQAHAQTVNPVPPPPPPVFNPSSPSTVAPTPEAPVSPTPPSALPGSAPPPGSPAVESPPAAPAVTPPPAAPAVVPPLAVTPPASPAVVPPPAPPAVTPQTTNAPAAAEPTLSPPHAGHHRGVRHRWNRRHARFHAVRVLGPSYYPGLGEFYPPYADPCHFSRVWHGYYAGYWAYGCF